MDFDLETMDSVREGPVGQVFWPDHIVFGHTGAGIIWQGMPRPSFGRDCHTKN